VARLREGSEIESIVLAA